MGKYVRIGGMWKGRQGTPCVASGRLSYDDLQKVLDGSGLHGKKIQLVLFLNDRRQNDRSPDYNLCICEDVPRARQEQEPPI